MSKEWTKVKKEEQLFVTSDIIQVKPDTKYRVNTTVIAKNGLLYSIYFMVSLQDYHGAELTRRIRWIDDFNGSQKEYEIVFKTSAECDKIVLGFSMNMSDNWVKSDLMIKFPDPKSLSVNEIEDSNNVNETYDDRINFTVPVLPLLSQKDEDVLEQKLVWIFGAPRSGNTWLAQRLLNHPKNILWDEPFLGRHLGIYEANYNHYDDNFHIKDIQRIYDDLKKQHHTYFFYEGHKNNWLPALRRLILSRAYSQVQTINKNVIVKEPAGSIGADIICETLPNSKMIFMIRDGRDSVDSRLAMFAENSWAHIAPFNSRDEKLRFTSLFSKEWAHLMNILNVTYERHNPKLRYLIKYESLRLDTFEELKKIYDFLNIEISDDDLRNIITKYDFDNIPPSEKGPTKFNRSALIGGWKNNSDMEEKSIMNSIMGDTLKKFGYEL